MYYPYFRGKQFELLTVRETSSLLAEKGFVPIIEPVRESLGGLQRALKAINDANGNGIVIVNPRYGDHQAGGTNIKEVLEELSDGTSLAAGVLLGSDMSVEDAVAMYTQHADLSPAFIHAGFSDGKGLSDQIGNNPENLNLFLEPYSGKLYRKHFSASKRILLRDGFKKRKNADYPLVEKFSDLHVTYEDEGASGFGDFLIVGDDYSESGGPAYAVAIHLTFIDEDSDDEMYTYHFVSKTNDTPTDPAGKFSEALNALVEKLGSGTSKLIQTKALTELEQLHAKGHFPGLGYVKKLSMKHHIETLAAYFD